MTLTAQCSNCASWKVDPAPGRPTVSQGFCMRGLAPDPGALLCHKYEVSARFKQDIISGMLKDHGPMAMPVKLMGGKKSARAFNKKRK